MGLYHGRSFCTAKGTVNRIKTQPSQEWWCTPVTPKLERWTQDCEFKTNLGYIAKLYLIKKKKISRIYKELKKMNTNFPQIIQLKMG
jgi:hypothetical protein